MAVIGIDLGTTNSLGAYWKDGRVQLIPMEGESFLLPSVVGYVEGEGFLAGAEVCRAFTRLLPGIESLTLASGHPAESDGAFFLFIILLPFPVFYHFSREKYMDAECECKRFLEAGHIISVRVCIALFGH